MRTREIAIRSLMEKRLQTTNLTIIILIWNVTKCGEIGHIERNCPTHIVVYHKGKRPPGKSNPSIGVSGIEPVSDNEFEDVKVLESLPLGAMCWEKRLDPPWHSYGDIPTCSRDELGDCYAMKIASANPDLGRIPMLTKNIPLP